MLLGMACSGFAGLERLGTAAFASREAVLGIFATLFEWKYVGGEVLRNPKTPFQSNCFKNSLDINNPSHEVVTFWNPFDSLHWQRMICMTPKRPNDANGGAIR